MPRFLGIDSSLSSSGLARIDVSVDNPFEGAVDPPSIDVWRIQSRPSRDKSAAAMSGRITEIVNAMEHHIRAADCVGLEGLSGGIQGSAAQVLPWLWGRIVDTCIATATPLVIVPPSLRCIYATGKGNAAKDAVLAAAIRKWPQVEISGNDEADALVVAAIISRGKGVPIDDFPEANWSRVMPKVSF